MSENESTKAYLEKRKAVVGRLQAAPGAWINLQDIGPGKRHLYSFVQIQTLTGNKKALKLSQSMNLSGEHNRKGKSVADSCGQEGKRGQQ